MISKSDQIGVCGFCRKSTTEVKVSVRSDDGTHICCECVDTCKDAIEKHERSKTDMLVQMWEQQRQFMFLLQKEREFPEFPIDITSKTGQQLLEGISFHMMKELFEAGQHLKNSKSHRATEIREVDRDAYKEELCDALHLYFEVCIAAGIDMEELFAAYMSKGSVNVERILSGY